MLASSRRLGLLAAHWRGPAVAPRLTTVRSASTGAPRSVQIGDVAVPLKPPAAGDRPELIPMAPSLRGTAWVDTEPALESLQWMMKKLLLRQDVFLLGSHPAHLRQLAFRFAEVVQREVEFVSISRDTTESDLKQRREIVREGSAGASVPYANQPVVEAALHGRLLVIEGLEKAERNLLPIINNLLENREMALEDGGFLMHPDRYDSLLREGSSPAELSRRAPRHHSTLAACVHAAPR